MSGYSYRTSPHVVDHLSSQGSVSLHRFPLTDRTVVGFKDGCPVQSQIVEVSHICSADIPSNLNDLEPTCPQLLFKSFSQCCLLRGVQDGCCSGHLLFGGHVLSQRVDLRVGGQLSARQVAGYGRVRESPRSSRFCYQDCDSLRGSCS